MQRPQVGEVYDWRSKTDDTQVEVHVVAYDAIRKIFTAVARDYDPVIDAYSDWRWMIFRQEAEDEFIDLVPGEPEW